MKKFCKEVAKRILEEAIVLMSTEEEKEYVLFSMMDSLLIVRADGEQNAIILGDVYEHHNRGYMYLYLDNTGKAFPSVEELTSLLEKVANKQILDCREEQAAYYGEDLEYFSNVVRAIAML